MTRTGFEFKSRLSWEEKRRDGEGWVKFACEYIRSRVCMPLINKTNSCWRGHICSTYSKHQVTRGTEIQVSMSTSGRLPKTIRLLEDKHISPLQLF